MYKYAKEGMKMNVSKRKMMLLGGEGGSLCEVTMDGKQFEHALEF